MGKKTKSKTKVTPWKPAEPYIKDAMSQLQSGYNAASGTIAKYSPALNDAIGRIQQNIAAPPSYVTDARSQLDKTINGDYINANPYSEGIAKLIGDRTAGNYASTFGASGRSHGGLAALLSSQGIGDALQSFYSNQYEGERGRQQQAIMAAPGFHQDEYTDLNALFPAVSNTAMLPLNAANAYGQGITGLTSPYSNTKTTQKQGGLGTALGLAAQIGGAILTGGASLPLTAAGGMSGLLSGGGLPGAMSFNPGGSFLGGGGFLG